MKKLNLGKDALMMSIITLLTILTWIGVEVYRMATKTTIPEVTQQQMLPLNPTLKREVLESLKTGLSFSEEELSTNSETSSESAVLGAKKKK